MARWLGRPFTVDGLIAVAAFGALLLDVAWAGPTGGARLAAIVFAAVMAGSLGWRRRAPLSSYAVGTAALGLQAVVVYTSELYPYVNLFGIYSAAVYGTRQRAQVALAVGLGGVVAFFSAYETNAPMLPLLIGLVWAGAWSAGYAVARRRDEAAVQHSAAVREAAIDERRRIARELHDLIGHTVNVMVVQAGAARRVIDRDPERARTALQTLEHIGRGALDELDRVLGILRDDTTPPGVEWHPPTGLADIDALADRFTQAGLVVTADVEGTPPPDVPRSLEVSAYRIVQEALTNTLKHAQASNVRVVVRHVDGAVELEVRDDGNGGTGAAPGRGITGMEERVALFGGRLEHGGDANGGFRVRAVLPLPAPANPAPPVPSS